MAEPGQDSTPSRAGMRDYRRRIEQLVRVLLGTKFSDAGEIWEFQIRLLELQRDVQGSIRKAKRQVPPDRGELDELRSIRWHARRLGDALAWILLDLDRQLIHPLARNERVPVPQDDHGHRGVQAIAAALSGPEWGFPLMHDVTDCLRIGDITFIKPERSTTTVEAKTRLVAQDELDDGSVSHEYEVSIVSPSALPDVPPVDSKSRQNASTRRNSVSDERMERQMRRLHVARSHQTADAGKVHQIDGSPVLSVRTQEPSSDHADALRRVVRRARRSGYGAESVDNAFFYVAVYDAEGFDSERLTWILESIPADLVSSGVLFEEERSRNSLVVFSVPSHEGRGPQLFLPYYLLPLPTSSIVDILQGRMMILNIVNAGRVVEALESAGFEVRHPSGHNDLAEGSMVVGTEIEDADGARYRAELHNLKMHLDEMTMEFRSLGHIVDVAHAFRDSISLVIEHQTSQLNDGTRVS